MKLYCVGIGPGGENQITPKAIGALKASDVVIGYHVYINLIRHLITDKESVSTPMKTEVDRCRLAVNIALSGKTVAIVSSGDAGVYGMASLIFEVLEELGKELDVEVVSGITAATSASAILGAPLTHDFAVVSLSDLLTDWSDIENRLDCASKSGFVICLYNPASSKRVDYLSRACKIVNRHLSGETPCGYVRNIAREGEISKVLTLNELSSAKVDMFTTVIIGNKNTKVINGRLVTPRGYKGLV